MSRTVNSLDHLIDGDGGFDKPPYFSHLPMGTRIALMTIWGPVLGTIVGTSGEGNVIVDPDNLIVWAGQSECGAFVDSEGFVHVPKTLYEGAIEQMKGM